MIFHIVIYGLIPINGLIARTVGARSYQIGEQLGLLGGGSWGRSELEQMQTIIPGN